MLALKVQRVRLVNKYVSDVVFGEERAERRSIDCFVWDNDNVSSYAFKERMYKFRKYDEKKVLHKKKHPKTATEHEHVAWSSHKEYSSMEYNDNVKYIKKQLKIVRCC